MEEIRVWSLAAQAGIGKPLVVPVDPIAETTTEQLLEEALTGHPELLMPNLRLIGRQNGTPGGPLDVLGMDEDGRLVVFELKRGSLTRDAVAQAIDYASFLADLEADELCRHIEANAGRGGTEQISDFSKWYQNQYQRGRIAVQVRRSRLTSPRREREGWGVPTGAARGRPRRLDA